MKFKIDENLPADFAEVLHSAGHDAATVLGQGLGGKPDSLIADACQKESRILVTLDKGFADIRAYPPEDFPGLMVLSINQQDKPHLLAVFRSALGLLGREPIEKHLWIIEENRVRIRGSDEVNQSP